MLLNKLLDCERDKELAALLRVLEFVAIRAGEIGADQLKREIESSKIAVLIEQQHNKCLH